MNSGETASEVSVSDASTYQYCDSMLNPSHAVLLPAIFRILKDVSIPRAAPRIFDLGCGNGAVAAELSRSGWDITGVDPSAEGISQARRAHPYLKLFTGSAYDDLVAQYGRFPIIISLEVVEHLYYPRKFAACVYSLLEEGGIAIISTPYHGYWKNLVLGVTGKWDRHFSALWDHGHIKFWSEKTLAILLHEAGFADLRFQRVGRIPALAKSMIAIATK